jgi:hypothetical protein
VVQIHSPRPFFSRRIMRVGAYSEIPLSRAFVQCAQNCAQPAFRPQREMHPRMGERSAWTSRLNCAQQSALESKHRSQTRQAASETCAATSKERMGAPYSP